MEIRPALPSEAPALTDLALRLFRETYRDQIPEEEIQAYVIDAYRPEVQLQELACPDGTVLVAVNQGQLAAYAQLRPSVSPQPMPGTRPLEVARFYVDSPWHGQGLAAELMAATRAWAAASGYDGIWLQVWEENPRAIRFYAKQGFQDIGETTFQVGNILYCDRVLWLKG